MGDVQSPNTMCYTHQNLTIAGNYRAVSFSVFAVVWIQENTGGD